MSAVAASPPAAPPRPSALRRGAGWLEWAAILAIFFVEGGAPAPHVNETHYLTKAKHYWDASYCPGDFFLDSADAHAAFYWTVGWLTRWLSLGATAWVGRVAAWALIAAGWQRLVRAVTPRPWAAALAAAAWVALIGRWNFAGEWVVGGVEGKAFAYGFVLLGFAAAARGEWRAPWLWFGAAAAQHVLVGGQAALLTLAAWLVEPRATRGTLRAVAPAWIAGGALALIGLLPALALERGADRATALAAAQTYVFQRLPHHLAPLTLEPQEVARRFRALAAVGFMFFVVWHECDRLEADAARASARVFRLAAFALLTLVAGLGVEWALADRPALAATLLRYYWFRLADVLVPMAIAIGAVAGLGSARRREWFAVATAVGLLAAGWRLAGVAVTRWTDPIPPATWKLDDLASWQGACAWIRDHAPADAMCLIPRDAQSFKWYAARADAGNWKDVPQDARGLVEWQRRLADIYPTVERFDGPRLLGSPEQWPARRVRETAARYGARYVVARIWPPLPLPRVYPVVESDDQWYAVYDLGAAPGQASP